VYQVDTAAIIAEIVSLRSPSKALIRTMDAYYLRFRSQRHSFIEGYWRAANKHVIEVATKHRVPVAHVYTVFMGLNGDQDPVSKDLVLLDEVHTTWQGAELMARLFRELGYRYAAP